MTPTRVLSLLCMHTASSPFKQQGQTSSGVVCGPSGMRVQVQARARSVWAVEGQPELEGPHLLPPSRETIGHRWQAKR